MTQPNELRFEAALNELERLVVEMETGQLDLDEALKRYERGIALVQFCRERLAQTEQRILELTSVDADGVPTLRPFKHEATTSRSQRTNDS